MKRRYINTQAKAQHFKKANKTHLCVGLTVSAVVASNLFQKVGQMTPFLYTPNCRSTEELSQESTALSQH